MDNKSFNVLSYLSAFFLPILIPVIVLIVGKKDDVKFHAKRALISQILSILLVIIFFIVFFFTLIQTPENTISDGQVIGMITAFAIMIIISLVITIWTIIQIVKVVR